MESQDNSAVPVQSTASDAVGRNAITATLAALYKGRQPKHYENPHPWKQGGPDPLDGISVWQRAEPIPHWHYITYGFSEQMAKQGQHGRSGFGFELTFRLAAEAQDSEPPLWPIHMLQNLGRYVYHSGNGFQHGHRLSANGPISLGTQTQLCAMGFSHDMELPAIDTPNGSVEFLQVIGMTAEEEAGAQKWDTRRLLELMLPYMPLWITHLQRASFLSFPAIQAKVAAGMQRDGSSSGIVFTDLLLVDETKRFMRQSMAQITLGAYLVGQLSQLLPLRLGYGKPFALCGPNWRIQFDLAKRKNHWRIERGMVRLFVTRAAVQEFATLLHQRQGVYKLPSFPNILWDVKQTTIRNAEGEIVDILG
jgi:suppressor of fused-like protein